MAGLLADSVTFDAAFPVSQWREGIKQLLTVAGSSHRLCTVFPFHLR